MQTMWLSLTRCCMASREPHASMQTPKVCYADIQYQDGGKTLKVFLQAKAIKDNA
jgi:hypothetical protein